MTIEKWQKYISYALLCLVIVPKKLVFI